MDRVDGLLTAALKRLPQRPDDGAVQATKRRYSEQMSEAIALAFADELRKRGMKKALPAPPGIAGLSGAEKRLAGGIGAKKVDVTWATEESGLVLAFSIKTINWRDGRSGNYQKNLTNRRGDMLIEAVSLHRRFPYAVLAGFFFMDWGASDDDTKQRRSTWDNAHQRLRLFTGRPDPMGREEQFERLFLVLVEANTFTPKWRLTEVGRPDQDLQLNDVFSELVTLIAERNFDFYQTDDGSRITRIRGS